jgi:hypothetical protein
MADQRRTIGGQVHAKACHVTALSECARRYGSEKKVKLVPGTVVNIDLVSNPSSNRTTTFITANYDLGGGMIKQKRLICRSVKSGAVPTTTPATPEATTNYNPTSTNNTATSTTATPEATTATPEATIATTTTLTTATQEATTATTATPEASTNNNATSTNNTATSTTATPEATTATTATPEAEVTAHQTAWFKDAAAIQLPINGRVATKKWGIRTHAGFTVGAGTDVGNGMSRLDYFLLMFPPRALTTICHCTNIVLNAKTKAMLTKEELLKFFGVIILCSKFEFSSRASLWSTTAPSKYVPAPAFGRTGMARDQFDNLWQCIRWNK